MFWPKHTASGCFTDLIYFGIFEIWNGSGMQCNRHMCESYRQLYHCKRIWPIARPLVYLDAVRLIFGNSATGLLGILPGPTLIESLFRGYEDALPKCENCLRGNINDCIRWHREELGIQKRKRSGKGLGKGRGAASHCSHLVTVPNLRRDNMS